MTDLFKNYSKIPAMQTQTNYMHGLFGSMTREGIEIQCLRKHVFRDKRREGELHANVFNFLHLILTSLLEK